MPCLATCLLVIVLSSSILQPVLSSTIKAAPTPRLGGLNATFGFRNRPKTHFSILQQLNPSFRGHNGTLSVLKAYRKYTSRMPARIAVLAQSGTLNATPVDPYDDEYVSPVTIGGQTMMLDFDTGSADLWVFSGHLPSSQRAGHDFYDASSDPDWRALKGYTFDIKYGDKSGVSGIVGTTTVQIGNVTVTGQAVEQATSVSAQFANDTGCDGLVGLGFSAGANKVSPKKQLTFFEQALPTLAKPVFTADLKHQAVGTYDFGVIDKSKYTGSITYTNVNSSSGFWKFFPRVDGVVVESVADTGTTLLLLPSRIVEKYWSGVAGSAYDANLGGYVFPCSVRPPDFSFEIEGTPFSIAGDLFNFGEVYTNHTCFGAMASNEGLPFAVWGDIMFKSIFIIFQGETPRLGFAAKP